MGEDLILFLTRLSRNNAITDIDLSLSHISANYGGVGNPINWNRPYLLVLTQQQLIIKIGKQLMKQFQQ